MDEGENCTFNEATKNMLMCGTRKSPESQPQIFQKKFQCEKKRVQKNSDVKSKVTGNFRRKNVSVQSKEVR